MLFFGRMKTIIVSKVQRHILLLICLISWGSKKYISEHFATLTIHFMYTTATWVIYCNSFQHSYLNLFFTICWHLYRQFFYYLTKTLGSFICMLVLSLATCFAIDPPNCSKSFCQRHSHTHTQPDENIFRTSIYSYENIYKYAHRNAQ